MGKESRGVFCEGAMAEAGECPGSFLLLGGAGVGSRLGSHLQLSIRNPAVISVKVLVT